MHALTCAISPDADDLFMFKALLEGQVRAPGFTLQIETKDTDALNRMAVGDGPDITAISIAHYPKVAAHYQLFNHGGSVGRNYGPIVVAPQPIGALTGRRIGVPGLTTTAYNVLRLAIGAFEPVVLPITPYTLTFDALRRGEVDAALVIHEGRLTFADEGFVPILDIGEWWYTQTQLPLPLGGNVIRRSLGAEAISTVDRAILRSIRHALDHRDAAIDWLLARGGALKTREQVDRYLAMYANDDTLDYGEDGRRAVRVLLHRCAEAGLLEPVETVDFVGLS